jgi:hypothetical protein
MRSRRLAIIFVIQFTLCRTSAPLSPMMSRNARHFFTVLLCASVPLVASGRAASAQHEGHGAARGATNGHGSRARETTGRDTAHVTAEAAYDTARARRWRQEWTVWTHTLVWGAAGVFVTACLGMAWLSFREHRERRLRKHLKKEQRRARSARRSRAATHRRGRDP